MRRRDGLVLGVLAILLNWPWASVMASGRADTPDTRPQPAPATPHTATSDQAQPTPPPPQAATGRRVDIRDGWFYVDGERFLVKGIGYSEARPGKLPWQEPTPLGLMERDFQLISEAGFNTIRTWRPLRPEAIALAKQYGLMVIQGIWLDQPKDFRSSAYRKDATDRITQEISNIRGHDNILATLVGNELPVAHVFLAGVDGTEELLQSMQQAVKTADPTRLVSYANWPDTALLDQSFFDFISYNTYNYNPLSVAYSLGYRGYLEHIKRSQAADTPFLVTEFGISVSPRGTGRQGYGGNSLDQQARGLVQLWDSVLQSGAAGGVVFEWMDEWWKNYEYPGDEQTHDDTDPEEWFGLMAVTDATQLHGTPRPALEALMRYNTAILVTPASTSVNGQVLIEVYNMDRVKTVRVKVDAGDWQYMAKHGQHWWRAEWDAASVPSGVRMVTVEALDAEGQVLTSASRPVWNISTENPHGLPWTVDMTTAQETVVTEGKLIPVTFAIRVRNSRGEPVAGQSVQYAITEPQIAASLHDTQKTDEHGLLRVKYLVRESGIVSCSAGVEFQDGPFTQRFGDERFLVVQTSSPPAVSARVAAADTLGADTLHARLGPELQRVLDVAPAWPLHDPGTAIVIDYAAYGTFVNVGKADYHYTITNETGLSAAVGEGVYPNEISIYRNPAYRQREEAGALEGDHWHFVNIDDTQLSYLKWATAGEEPGVKQFYTAMALERAGHIAQAIKAYYAILVHFPQSIGWTYFQTPWSVGKGALDRVHYLTRMHPALGVQLVDADVIIRHGFDNDITNDEFIVNPGHLVRVDPAALNGHEVLQGMDVKRAVGHGAVQLVQLVNGHWQLRVDGKPFVVRAVTYGPTAVGESPDVGNMQDWTKADRNGNKTLDVFETWVDRNGNNQRDPDEPVTSDFALLKQMGANAIRMYHHGAQHKQGIDQAVLRRMWKEYGLRVIMGDFVGMYTVGSGATWEAGTDYRDETQRANMKASVQQMVHAFKDEPYILMWVLGNENNYGGMHGFIGGEGNAGKYPDVYYAFINELAEWIHQADPNHPVMIGNGEVLHLDVMAQHAPAVDVVGINSYRGAAGFSHTLWRDVQQLTGKPAMIAEFGCPAYHEGKSHDIAEAEQAQYLLGNWLGIEQNMAGRGVGNALGGGLFSWVDEWWKAGQPPRFDASVHEAHAGWAGPFPDGWSHEEWFGVTSQGNGSHSPYLRELRLAYRLFQRLWISSSSTSSTPVH